MQKPKIIQARLQVSRKTYITPHYLRVYLTGEEVFDLAETTVGINNKILIPPRGVDKVYFPTINPETGKREQPEEAIRPIMRTYTHRGIDVEKREVWIDFVAHGDEGPASAWAMAAQPGDELGVMMKYGKRELYSTAKHYLLVGDATAIPVLSAILEDLPAEAKATCFIEVHGKEDEQDLISKAQVKVHWVHNPTPQAGSSLAEMVKQSPLPQTDRFAYVAAEFQTVKTLRTYLRKIQNWEREEVYAFSYWKAGVAENDSAKSRREERQTE